MTQQQLDDDGNGLAEMLTIAYGKGYTAAQEKYRAEIDALAARVAEQDDTIRELQDALDGMRGIAKDRQARVQELEAQLASREDDIYLWGRATEERKRLEAKVAELEETLAFAAQYKGFEGRACPLCKYEDGVFIEHCQMHKDMHQLRAQLATVESMRRVWKNAAKYKRQQHRNVFVALVHNLEHRAWQDDEIRRLNDQLESERVSCTIQLQTLMIESDDARAQLAQTWQPVENNDVTRQLLGQIIMAIDMTGKHGPYAVCRLAPQDAQEQ